jgi:hypothetical protein
MHNWRLLKKGSAPWVSERFKYWVTYINMCRSRVASFYWFCICGIFIKHLSSFLFSLFMKSTVSFIVPHVRPMFKTFSVSCTIVVNIWIKSRHSATGCYNTTYNSTSGQEIDIIINLNKIYTQHGAHGSVVGWGTTVQAGWSPVRIPDEADFFNLPNPSSSIMALGSTQPLTEGSTRYLPGGKKQLAHRADNLAAIYELNVWKCGCLNPSQPYGPPWPIQG